MQKITAFAKAQNLNISSRVQNQTAPIYLNKKTGKKEKPTLKI